MHVCVDKGIKGASNNYSSILSVVPKHTAQSPRRRTCGFHEKSERTQFRIKFIAKSNMLKPKASNTKVLSLKITIEIVLFCVVLFDETVMING